MENTSKSYIKIYWHAFSREVKKLPSNKTFQITKISSNWIPTNERLHKIDKTNKKFPTCNINTETISHMIKFTLNKHPHILEKFKTKLRKIKK